MGRLLEGEKEECPEEGAELLEPLLEGAEDLGLVADLGPDDSGVELAGVEDFGPED